VVKIVERLKPHYGKDMLSRTHVCFEINEVQWRRTDLKTIASPGREPEEGLAAVIAGKPDGDPHFSAAKLAQSLGIAASTVYRYLTQVLAMKSQQLRWGLHTLAPAQKLMRAQLTQSMLQPLAKHEHRNDHFLLTCDES
jgi:DNA-binding MurR/RpiR family transcriptional regulator